MHPHQKIVLEILFSVMYMKTIYYVLLECNYLLQIGKVMPPNFLFFIIYNPVIFQCCVFYIVYLMYDTIWVRLLYSDYNVSSSIELLILGSDCHIHILNTKSSTTLCVCVCVCVCVYPYNLLKEASDTLILVHSDINKTHINSAKISHIIVVCCEGFCDLFTWI